MAVWPNLQHMLHCGAWFWRRSCGMQRRWPFSKWRVVPTSVLASAAVEESLSSTKSRLVAEPRSGAAVPDLGSVCRPANGHMCSQLPQSVMDTIAGVNGSREKANAYLGVYVDNSRSMPGVFVKEFEEAWTRAVDVRYCSAAESVGRGTVCWCYSYWLGS